VCIRVPSFIPFQKRITTFDGKGKYMKSHRYSDPLVMPGSSQSPQEILSTAHPLEGTDGEAYIARRGIPIEIANAFGLRFHDNFGGRPAVVVALRDNEENIISVHGRYLSSTGRENKMLTVGKGGGAISLADAWRADPFIVVEGLFDALSLATTGWQAIATIGRQVPWLSIVTADRVVWAAFDTGRPGEANVDSYKKQLYAADVRRLPPPPRCKDWNTALVKRGPLVVSKWVRDHVDLEGLR
jgi:hypothetical protein